MKQFLLELLKRILHVGMKTYETNIDKNSTKIIVDTYTRNQVRKK